MPSKIEWTDETWNPVRGCSRVSPGCNNCYAMRQAHRSDVPGGAYEGLTILRRGRVDWTGRARLVPELLAAPLRWTRPRRVFVNSMSDLFHESLTRDEIAGVFAAMALACHHTYQVLTKRAARMRAILETLSLDECLKALLALGFMDLNLHSSRVLAALPQDSPFRPRSNAPIWPLPNVWLGVSVEDQARADERIPLLLETPAAVRFVSAEPLLGPLHFRRWLTRPPRELAHRIAANLSAASGRKHMVLGPPDAALDWVIVGGESGHGARPCDLVAVRSVVEQCASAGVPCFVKQLGADPIDGTAGCEVHLRSPKGGDPSEWPAELRVREWPEGRP